MNRAAFVVFVAFVLSPAVVRADGLDAQVSSRLSLGGGAAFENGLPEALLDLGGRLDVYLGEDRPARVRLGPELELRTATFASIEVLLGPALLLPIGSDFTLGLVISAGYAWRLPRALDPSRDGPLVAATLRFGYQPYDHWDPYSMGLHVYVTGRAGVQAQELYEIVLGLEVDFELLFVAPVAFLITALAGHDPDEPVTPPVTEPDEVPAEATP